MLGHVWPRLADLLVAHTQAEQETWYLPLVGTGASAPERIRDSIADHDEIRGIIGEAAVQPVGSAPWWRMVRAVMTVSAEHLEHEERDVLPDCRADPRREAPLKALRNHRGRISGYRRRLESGPAGMGSCHAG